MTEINYRFCYQESVKGGSISPCTPEAFFSLVERRDVAATCAAIRALNPQEEGFEEKKQELKKRLPVILPHAYAFTEGKRKSEQAIPSGLVMLDIDHIANPRDVFTIQIEPLTEQNRLALVAVTPSGHGLRIIGERYPEESIEQAQQRLATALDFEEYDGVTKDLARASFVMPADDILYIKSERLFAFENEETKAFWLSFKSQTENFGSSQPLATEIDGQKNFPTDYNGIPYEKIAARILEQMGVGQQVLVGERNSVYFSLCTHMRYICDFNPNFLVEVLPDFGLSKEERQSAAQSAVHRPRKGDKPLFLQSAIAWCAQEAAEEETPSFDVSNLQKMPRLPRVLQILCRRVPEAYRPALLMASLPIMGALATRVRFLYIDKQEHSLSFFTCISAPAASGKSFIRRPIDLLLTPINEQDEIEREKEREYKEKMKRSKNAKNQPEDPHACPRNNGVNISVAKLLQLLTYNESKHLVAVSEEMDTIVKSEKAGVWSQKSDIYRLGFDNSEYGQNYMSDNSFSAKVRVYYNLLLTGTPGSMKRFFKGDELENGLMTRTCFAQLPDTAFCKMPVFEPYTQKEQEEVLQWARKLDSESGYISCEIVANAIDEWQERKRQEASRADSHAADIIRRRAAVIGYRAGMLFYLLEGRQNKRNVAELALWVAEYTFQNQLDMWGQQLEQQLSNGDSEPGKGQTRALLDYLPSVFTTEDLIAMRIKRGQSTKRNSLHSVICRWKKEGLIETAENGSYRKV